ncbi:hypothetical protein C9H80_13705 [Clostridioides difficile]|nr:hypothetical protein [Clostridioides difficile]EGT5137331.1 hypothetical protein [Clostridioides difficile]EGT5284560.1 hypothetical protein [Clostridioides difficile]
MFWLNIRLNTLSFSCYCYYRRNCPLLQATHFNILNQTTKLHLAFTLQTGISLVDFPQKRILAS